MDFQNVDLRFEPFEGHSLTMKNEFLQVEKVGLNDPAFLEKTTTFSFINEHLIQSFLQLVNVLQLRMNQLWKI